MKKLIIAFAFLVLVPNLVLADPTRDLIDIWSDLNDMCRGWPGDTPHIDEVCVERDKVGTTLDALGWCYGKKGQRGDDMAWHRCGRNSIHFGAQVN